MSKRNNFDKLMPKSTIEERIRKCSSDADMLAGEINCLIVLDGKVIVIDAVDGESDLRGGAAFGLSSASSSCCWLTVFEDATCAPITDCRRLVVV